MGWIYRSLKMPSNGGYEELIINTEASARSFLEILSEDINKSPDSERFITVDTEFIRENQPEPLLCLVQIATAYHAFLIDPLVEGVDFATPLSSVLGDPDLLKVFHSAAQDIEVLEGSFGAAVYNIYDTQLHEMLLSTREYVSYKNLVRKYLGKHLDKTCVISDWRQRPLSKKQLRYSVGDVTFLRDIYKAQRSQLEQMGRLHWLKDEMLELEERFISDSSISADADIEKQLSLWIEERSKEKNIHLKDIMGRQHTVAKICRKGRAYIDKLLKYRGLHNKNFRDFLLFAKTVVPQNLEAEEDERHIGYRHSLEISALKLILEMVSKNSSVAQSLIATTEDLESLLDSFIKADDSSLDAVSDLRCLQGWRYEIFGRYAEGFLREEISISMIDGGKVGFKSRSES